jgi:hypothetical protein
MILAEKDKEYRAIFTTKSGEKITEKLTPIAFEQKSTAVLESSAYEQDMGINGDGTVNELAHTKPDIFVETTYNHFLEGKDTVLNKAVELCK